MTSKKSWQIIKLMIYLPTIQILIYLEQTIPQYYQKVKRKKGDLRHILDLDLDFSRSCPICGGANCARFLDYYEREVIDENGTYYKAVPIARYICYGKGLKRKGKPKTFSLLPYQLVPYSKYSLPFIIKTLKKRHVDDLSISKLQDYLAAFGDEHLLAINDVYLLKFKKLIMEAINKLMITNNYDDFREAIAGLDDETKRIRCFIDFAQSFRSPKITDPQIRGPDQLAYDYYLTHGGYLQNAHFLFGTPSQFR